MVCPSRRRSFARQGWWRLRRRNGPGQQLIDQSHGRGGGGVLLPGGAGSGDGEGVLLSAGQPDVGGDVLAAADQGGGGDEQPAEAFALPHRCRGVVPEGG